MSFKDFYQKEKYVVLNGQPRNFRIVKYIVILGILIGLYFWKGFRADIILIIILALVGTAVHFFFRWKTKGWEKAWGPYKPL